MTHYYALTFNMTIRDLGLRKSFSHADEADQKLHTGDGSGEDTVYIAQKDDLRDLRKAIDLVLS
jgi:hypothetical protein